MGDLALTCAWTTRIAEALRAHGVRYALVFGAAARNALVALPFDTARPGRFDSTKNRF